MAAAAALPSVQALQAEIAALRADLVSVSDQLAAAQAAAVEGLAAQESSRRPVVICVDHGLCNRLRAVLTYGLMAQNDGRELVVVWKADAECNGHFLDCFQPLPGVRFVREAPSWAPTPDLVNNAHPEVGIADEIQAYECLAPTAAIAAAVSARVGRLSPFVAVHVRRTDLPGYHGRRLTIHD